MKTRLTILFASVLFVFVSCNEQPAADSKKAETAAPTAEDLNKAAYREIAKAITTGNTDSLGKYVADNFKDNAPAMPGITSTGLQYVKDVFATYKKSFSDLSIDFHHVVADGDLVFAHATWKGTNDGEFMGEPATGKAATGEFAEVLRFENGKATERWEVAVNVDYLTQLGVIPPTEPAPAAVSLPTYNWDAKVENDDAKEAKMKDVYKAVVPMIESGDLSKIDQYLVADFKENISIPGVTLQPGIEGAKQAMTLLKTAYPDMKNEIKHMAAEGDVLLVYFTMTGTFGSMPGVPSSATGKKVTVNGVDIIQFNSEGKAIAHWAVSDHLSEMTQLGLVPPMGAPQGEASAK